MKLDRLEWDFSDVFPDEISDCLDYELSRHARPEFIDSALKYRKDCGSTFEELLDNFRYSGEEIIIPYRSLFVYFPEWPNKPFLSVHRSSRKTRAELFHKKKGILVESPLVQRSFAELHAQWGSVDAIHYDETTIAALEIDWTCSNAELLNRFRVWLTMARPKGLDPEKQTGGGSESRQMKYSLECLGVFRFWSHFQGNWAKIEANNLPVIEAYGKSYNHQSQWSEANKKARQLLSGDLTFTETA